MPNKLALPSISLCMIVRNESPTIDLALKSACPFVDEIIIVDTGSTDNTIEICRTYTDKIYHFAWVNDFAAARNESLKYASKEWILIIDADELLEPVSTQRLKSFLALRPVQEQVFTAVMYNMSKVHALAVVNGQESYLEYSGHQHIRLFRNNCGFQYKYSLHETIVLPHTDLYKSPVKVMHYGYTDVTKERGQRALACLQRDLLKYPDDLFVQFNMARTFVYLDQLDEAFAWFEKILRQYAERKTEDPNILRVRFYEEYLNILLSCQRYIRAEKIAHDWRALVSPGFDIRPEVALAKIYFMTNRNAEAFAAFSLLESRVIQESLNHGELLEGVLPRLVIDIAYFLGTLYLLQGNTAYALPRLAKAYASAYMRDNVQLEKLYILAGGIKS